MATRDMAPKGTLLIVDDEAGVRESLTMVFKDQYNVITAGSGREAVQIACNQPIDVVILDILLGDMSGTEVLREIKSIDPQIEVVMLTGCESLDTARASVKYGAADYISKPFDVSSMRELIAECFEGRRLAAETEFSLQELQTTTKELEAELSTKERKLAAAATLAAKRTARENDEEPFVHWREYGLILLERKWITITTLVAVVAVALIWNFKTTPIFRATTRLQTESEDVKVLNIQDVVSTDTRDQQYLNTQLKILQSRTLAEQVVKSLALDKDRDFIPDAPPDMDFAEALQNCLTVQLVRDSRLIDISTEHPNPEMAQLLANGVANEFIKQNLDRKMSASLDAVRWLRQQADEYKLKVDKSEGAIQEYREKTGSVSLEEHQNIVVEKLKELSSAVTKARTEALNAEIEWNKVKGFIDAGQSLLTLPSIVADPQVTALRQQLNDKQIAIGVLRERYKDKHPTMVSAVAELKEIQQRLTTACNEAAENIKASHLMARTREENLQQALKEQEKMAIDLSNKMVEYTALKRNAEADKQLYESILTRMKEAGITGKLDINNIRVVDPAQTPKFAYKPRKLRNLMLAGMLGLLCGIGLSFAAHFYDDKIKTFDDIESFLGLPLLSSVPDIGLKDELERSRVAQLEPHSLSSESFRNLRASIHLSANKDASPLLVTSTAPGEGKSLVASNLAIVFAHNNHRTLLIDADMRRPVLHRVFKTDTRQGLSRFLAGSDSFEEIVQPTEVPNLDIIVVGTVPPNPPELLGSDKLHELLAIARDRYERIVIDSPPITAVSDPLLLLPHTEGVIFVVHFGKIRREIVARAVHKLRESGATMVGAVMNNISIEKHGYHYYPYRYSHYYRQHTEKEKPAAFSHS